MHESWSVCGYKKSGWRTRKKAMNECCGSYYSFKIYYILTWLPFFIPREVRKIRKPVAFAIGQCSSGELQQLLLIKFHSHPHCFTKMFLFIFFSTLAFLFQVITLLRGIKLYLIGNKNFRRRMECQVINYATV